MGGGSGPGQSLASGAAGTQRPAEPGVLLDVGLLAALEGWAARGSAGSLPPRITAAAVERAHVEDLCVGADEIGRVDGPGMNVLYLTSNPNRTSSNIPTEGWFERLGPKGLRPVLVSQQPG